MDNKLKGLLYSVFARKKFIHVLENASLTASDENDLVKLENKIIEKLLNLPNSDYTTPVLEALGIQSISKASIDKKDFSLDG